MMAKPMFEEAYAVHRAYVYGIMRKSLPVQYWDDAVQDTFIRVWRHWETYDPTRPLKMWVGVIAKNVAIDYVRRLSVRPSNIALEKLSLVDPHDDLQRIIDKEYAQREISSLIADVERTSPKRAQFLRLAASGMDYGEIAQCMGTPCGLLRWWMNQIREKYGPDMVYSKNGWR